jgi:hypothetical protein
MFDPDELKRLNAEDEEDTHGLRGATIDPARLASPALAQAMPAIYNDYVDLRVQGIPRDMAAIEAMEAIRHGIDISNINAVAAALEMNPYTRARFRKVLESKDIKRELWSRNKAVNHLLQLVEDQSVRDTTRLNAISALNVFCGYQTVDDGLARRVQQTLKDFDRLNAEYSDIIKVGKGDDGAPLMN